MAWASHITPEQKREYYRQYRLKNKEKVRNISTKWRENNRELAKLRTDQWKTVHPERQKISEENYRKNNKEKRKITCKTYRDLNIEKERVSRKIWCSKNKAKLAVKSAMRRALKLQATPSWADVRSIATIYEHAQAITKETGIAYHVDHIVPLKSKYVCGLHVEHNLQILLGRENFSKCNRHWPDMPSLDGC